MLATNVTTECIETLLALLILLNLFFFVRFSYLSYFFFSLLSSFCYLSLNNFALRAAILLSLYDIIGEDNLYISMSNMRIINF